MPKYPIPAHLANKVAQDAVKYARETMKGYGWSNKSIRAIQPMSRNGQVGIRTTSKYLMYQEEGTKPALMHWVEGRVIPLACGGSDSPHFRRGGNVGLPGYVNIPHVGTVWRDQRWRHPGIQARGFMAGGVDRAVKENIPGIRRWAIRVLGIK